MNPGSDSRPFDFEDGARGGGGVMATKGKEYRLSHQFRKKSEGSHATLQSKSACNIAVGKAGSHDWRHVSTLKYEERNEI